MNEKFTLTVQTIKDLVSVASPVVVLIGAIASVYIVATLAPLKQDLALGSQRIFAVEEQIKELKQIQLDRVSKYDVEIMIQGFNKRFDTLEQMIYRK